MAVNEVYPEFLFSYGTLQLEAVQMATFGRQLAGTSDALQGFEPALLKIEDQTVVAISGKAHHTMARFTGRASDVVSGEFPGSGDAGVVHISALSWSGSAFCRCMAGEIGGGESSA